MMKSILEKKKVDIDLTSLLDVIFIILLVVMCSIKMDASSSDVVDPGSTSNQIVAPDPPSSVVTTEDVSLVRITVGYDEEDYKSRHIFIYYNDADTAGDEISFTQADAEEAYETFADKIEDFVEAGGQRGVPVLLRIDDTRMLHRDAVRIDEIIANMDETYDNLFAGGIAQ